MGSNVRRRFLWLLSHSLNRVTTPLARTRFGPFSLIQHVGRKSGRPLETPVILAADPAGFIAELTYGDQVDWYRNIVAAGGCTAVYRGKPYLVVAVEPCGTQRGRAAYPAPLRFVLKATGRHEFRLLRTAVSDR